MLALGCRCTYLQMGSCFCYERVLVAPVMDRAGVGGDSLVLLVLSFCWGSCVRRSHGDLSPVWGVGAVCPDSLGGYCVDLSLHLLGRPLLTLPALSLSSFQS